jgi:hypothetical protein
VLISLPRGPPRSLGLFFEAPVTQQFLLMPSLSWKVPFQGFSSSLSHP